MGGVGGGDGALEKSGKEKKKSAIMHNSKCLPNNYGDSQEEVQQKNAFHQPVDCSIMPNCQ